MKSGTESAKPRTILLPFLALAVCVFLWSAMLTFNAGDWPSPHQFPHNQPTANACGPLGAWCAYYLYFLLGFGFYPVLLFATSVAACHLIHRSVNQMGERFFGLALVVICTSTSAHLIARPGTSGLFMGHGGLMGYGLGDWLSAHLSRLGTVIVLATSLVVGLLFATEGWVLKLPRVVVRTGKTSAHAANAVRRILVTVVNAPRSLLAAEGVSDQERTVLLESPDTPSRIRQRNRYNRLDRRGRKTSAIEEEIQEPQIEGEEVDIAENDGLNEREEYDANTVDEEEGEVEEGAARTEEIGGVGETAESRRGDSGKSRKATDKARAAVRAHARPVVNFSSADQAAAAEAYPRQIENWTLPSLDLLEEPEYGFDGQQEVIVREQARILERTLEEFRIQARVVEIDTGPVITMFELKLGAGIKVSQIAALSNDIARALKAHAIRIVAPISGKNTIGVEVPNIQKEKVRLKELIQLAGKRASEMSLPLFLGKDAAGQPLVANLTKMPHLLIAGTTGSGKSVCLNAVILSILMTKRPDHVKLIIVDPKMVEMSQYKDVPHLMCPIVTDMVQAEKILEWAVVKMEERYELLAETRVKNIAGYNNLEPDELYKRLQAVSEAEKNCVVTHLPFIVIIIDELADLMMTCGKEVEHHLSRLAQKSRAVGIHIIVATQRPEVKVVTGLVKSNLPSRICFRVASRMDSRIVLDQNGGEVLLGQGDMLFLPPGSHKTVRSQGTYLGDAEVQAVLEDLADRARPEFHPELLSLRKKADADLSLRDPLFDDAVKIVLRSKRGSVSLLQRKLTIGYSRASRLIEQMGEAGIIGEYKGSQARETLMTLDQWEALKAQVDAELEEGYEADQDDYDYDANDADEQEV